MTSEEIKQLRNGLDLTQDELANILGVNKSTITRWEMDNNSSPTGDTEKKLLLLQKFYKNNEEKKEIINIKSIAGIAAIAGLLATGISLFPVGKFAIRGITLSTILTLLQSFLTNKTINK